VLLAGLEPATYGS